MGLSAFSRSRVSQLPELELEAERFERWNKTHQASFRALDELHHGEKIEDEIVEIREAMLEGVKAIGEKVVAGLAENTKEGDSIDMPLRIDHVRDLVGRRHVEDPQGEPKTILERLHERIPTGGTASEKLVNKTDVDGEGPTKEEVEAAEEEQLPWTEYEEDLPEPGDGAGVKGEKVVKPGDTSKRTVPKTTAAAPPETTKTTKPKLPDDTSDDDKKK